MIAICGIYYWRRNRRMPAPGIAKLFRNGRSQAVRLPRLFRFAGSQLRERRLAEGGLLEALIADPGEWFAELDRVREGQFLGKGRNQPAPPRRKIFKGSIWSI